jgi:hypothetical protein
MIIYNNKLGIRNYELWEVENPGEYFSKELFDYEQELFDRLN